MADDLNNNSADNENMRLFDLEDYLQLDNPDKDPAINPDAKIESWGSVHNMNLNGNGTHDQPYAFTDDQGNLPTLVFEAYIANALLEGTKEHPNTYCYAKLRLDLHRQYIVKFQDGYMSAEWEDNKDIMVSQETYNPEVLQKYLKSYAYMITVDDIPESLIPSIEGVSAKTEMDIRTRRWLEKMNEQKAS